MGRDNALKEAPGREANKGGIEKAQMVHLGF